MSNSVRQAQEEVEVRNIKAVIEYSKQTREYTRVNEKSVKELKNMIIQQNDVIQQLREMIINIIKDKYGN